ncbi:hypothetical protein CVN76_00820, partial [Bacillus sp. mrc49]
MGALFFVLLSFMAIMFIQKEDHSETDKEKRMDAIAENQEKIDKMLESMTLEEKVGQLMMIGFKGTEAGPEINELIEKNHIGGIIYF